MFRILSFALALFGTNAAWGQTTYDPKIGYTQVSGNTQYLYLANEDGSRAVRVATVGRDPSGFAGNIHGVDFAPGGGRIAYSDASGLWVLSYTATNSTIRIDKRELRVPGGYGILIGPPDFSPDGSRIVYGTNSPSYSFRAIPAEAGPSVLIYDGPYAAPNESVRWLRSADMGNALAFLTPIPNGSGVYEIWTVLLDVNDRVTSAGPLLSTGTQAFSSIRDFDIVRTRNALLISVYYPTEGYRIVELDIGSGNIAPTGASGIRVHYSADDSRLISVSPDFDYVASFDPSSGVTTRLTKKGRYTRTDARP